MSSSNYKDISLEKVSTNNLKDIDVNFPISKLIVVTGVSGSGKSSLVFDSLFAESYRRYLESLSSFARQYIKSLPKPQLKSAKNLPAATAVRQARASGASRSTVASLTEIDDLLQVIFTHRSELFCYSCDEKIISFVPKKVKDELFHSSYFNLNESLLILAPLTRWQGMKSEVLSLELRRQGFSRIWSQKNGLRKITENSVIDSKKDYCVSDRVFLSKENTHRIEEACEIAWQISQGDIRIFSQESKKIKDFSSKLNCSKCLINYKKAQISLFNANHPMGACGKCQGYGKSAHIDWQKVFPDKNLSIKDEGIAPLNFGSHKEYYSFIKKSAKEYSYNIELPFAKYSKKQMEWLCEGDNKSFQGMKGYFEWLSSKSYKPHYRMHLAKYRLYKTCDVCQGRRFSKDALAYKICGVSVADSLDMSVESFYDWIYSNVFSEKKEERKNLLHSDFLNALEELKTRLSYLKKIGVSYLGLLRSAKTLSGGELQRINMARCLGNQFSDTLYCLDEPTAGLHPQDSQKLLEILYELRDMGNTVVVVEHEEKIIEHADYLMEIGPHAGHNGGQLIYSGKPNFDHLVSLARKEMKTFHKDFVSKKNPKKFIHLKGCFKHNLKNISVKLPLSCLIGVCGVSGSGKTTLIKHTLYPLLHEKILGEKLSNQSLCSSGISPSSSLSELKDVQLVSQETLGRNSRSTIATYLGVWQEIRKIFAQEELAKRKGLTVKDFSFNSPGGRCEQCKGLGTIEEDLSFLGSVKMICEVCSGQRFLQDILEVKYKGVNLYTLLQFTVEQAYEFFLSHPKILKILQAVLQTGLGYVTLGQSLSSFSGGEAQRLKLLSLMRDVKKDRPSFLIFDEPTTGLSNKDVIQLIKHFNLLVSKGHTVCVVEHHVGMLKSCDWLVELGPGSSDAGGSLVYEGVIEKFKESKESVTAKFF